MGQNGKQCTRPALASGFCERHDPESATRPTIVPVLRIALAVIVLMAFLWPLIADTWREIARLLR